MLARICSSSLIKLLKVIMTFYYNCVFNLNCTFLYDLTHIYIFQDVEINFIEFIIYGDNGGVAATL